MTATDRRAGGSRTEGSTGTVTAPPPTFPSPVTRLLAARLPVALLLAALGCGGVGDEGRVLRLAHGLDPGHPVHVAMEHLAAEAERLSEGRLRVVVYPSEQLGSERELIELLQIGSVAMTKTSASVLEGFDPRFGVLGTPYLFRSREHQFAVLDGDVGDELLDGLPRVRLRGLGFYDAGSRSFYTCAAAVRSPRDLEGLKIRTQESTSAMAMVRSLGGHPTPISWGELYTALAQGVVDGAENNPPSFHTSRHFEVCPHYSLDEHTAVPDVLVASEDVWSRLDAGEREVLRRAVASSVALQRRLWAEATEQALEDLAAAGVEIVHPDQASFRERASVATTAEDGVLIARIRAVSSPDGIPAPPRRNPSTATQEDDNP